MPHLGPRGYRARATVSPTEPHGGRTDGSRTSVFFMRFCETPEKNATWSFGVACSRSASAIRAMARSRGDHRARHPSPTAAITLSTRHKCDSARVTCHAAPTRASMHHATSTCDHSVRHTGSARAARTHARTHGMHTARPLPTCAVRWAIYKNTQISDRRCKLLQRGERNTACWSARPSPARHHRVAKAQAPTAVHASHTLGQDLLDACQPLVGTGAAPQASSALAPPRKHRRHWCARSSRHKLVGAPSVIIVLRVPARGVPHSSPPPIDAVPSPLSALLCHTPTALQGTPRPLSLSPSPCSLSLPLVLSSPREGAA
eukprot:6019116-Prymnesium_polylepis.1